MKNDELIEMLDDDKVVITLSEYEDLLDCKKQLLLIRRSENESL